MAALEKGVWTDADFEDMGWHDATLYAVAIDWDAAIVGERGADLLLDIDYIVEWIPLGDPGRHYEFLVAPATLVFEDTWNVEGDFALHDNSHLEILDLNRDKPDDGPAGFSEWHIAGHQFDVYFRARGFRQHFRQHALRVGRQRLLPSERGAPNFCRPDALPA